MKHLILPLLSLACVAADVPLNTIKPVTNHALTQGYIESFRLYQTTNRVTNLLAVIRMADVPGPCPECGAPNHHQQQVAMMSAQDVIYANVVAEGRTNTMRVATGAATNWVQTNVVYRLPGLWPNGAFLTNSTIPLLHR